VRSHKTVDGLANNSCVMMTGFTALSNTAFLRFGFYSFPIYLFFIPISLRKLRGLKFDHSVLMNNLTSPMFYVTQVSSLGTPYTCTDFVIEGKSILFVAKYCILSTFFCVTC
jgi:hypothetical protein